MAWTAPRTWVTGETVTAALMNAHVRDNLLKTSPAIAASAGDLFYADAANSVERLAIGSSAQFLVGGTGVPDWSNRLEGPLSLDADSANLRLYHSDGIIDADDYWTIGVSGNDDDLFIGHWDDSASAWENTSLVRYGDYLLHTGNEAVGAGAVVVATAEMSASAAATTSGSIVVEATLATGGPAYVRGFYNLRISRDSASSHSQLTIIVREDGSNLSSEFGEWSGSTFIADAIPSASDGMGYHGTFWRRVTSSDSSDYEIFVSSGDNSIFTVESGNIYVESIQYPT